MAIPSTSTVLVALEGNQSHPIRDVTFRGLVFRFVWFGVNFLVLFCGIFCTFALWIFWVCDLFIFWFHFFCVSDTPPSYFEPRGMPSGFCAFFSSFFAFLGFRTDLTLDISFLFISAISPRFISMFLLPFLYSLFFFKRWRLDLVTHSSCIACRRHCQFTHRTLFIHTPGWQCDYVEWVCYYVFCFSFGRLDLRFLDLLTHVDDEVEIFDLASWFCMTSAQKSHHNAQDTAEHVKKLKEQVGHEIGKFKKKKRKAIGAALSTLPWDLICHFHSFDFEHVIVVEMKAKWMTYFTAFVPLHMAGRSVSQ